MREMKGVPYLGRVWNRGTFGKAIPSAHVQPVNPPRFFSRDLERYGAPAEWPSGYMVGLGGMGDTTDPPVPLSMKGLFDSDPDVVFRGCENPGAAAAYLLSTKVDALLKGITAGVVVGALGVVALGYYLKKRGG